MIRREKFDLVVNLQPGSRSEIATELSGARTRVGYERKKMRRSCYTTALHHEWRGEYCVEEMLKPLRAVGIEAEVELPTIGLSDSDREAVRSYLDEDSRPLVVLHPGRDDTNKVWLDERFSELARALIERYGVRVAFVGTGSESEKVERIVDGVGHPCASFAGKLNLREVGALAAGAKLFIGIDSSPMHIASAVGTPTIALFGPSDPKVWNPPGEDHIVVFKDPAEPRECGEPHCPAGECLRMRNIHVEDILPAVEKLLSCSCKAV
jgi:ADP-heptose:LPS heptosyltransferase